jgi:excinuclease UvrABC nuclease subunit
MTLPAWKRCSTGASGAGRRPTRPETVGKKPDPAFAVLPDLLLVDGGKGQLSRAVAVLEAYNLLDRSRSAGLAKSEEELFVPGQHESIYLERHSQGLYLVQRIRDEAHRFAITAHRKRRSKQGLASRLDVIPGIGPARRKALLNAFGSIDGIKDASAEKIAEIKGITLDMAQYQVTIRVRKNYEQKQDKKSKAYRTYQIVMALIALIMILSMVAMAIRF